MVSQIDITPTILGLLNFTYRSKFFGKDILQLKPEQGRALIGNYEKLGYITHDVLAVLDIKKQASLYRFNRTTGESEQIPIEQNIVDEAISYYQGADYLFKTGYNKLGK
jgi:phosphoglycerol transferase MdoB-like AlkP superfamily enzyme